MTTGTLRSQYPNTETAIDPPARDLPVLPGTNPMVGQLRQRDWSSVSVLCREGCAFPR
jgi:hypothetical protein